MFGRRNGNGRRMMMQNEGELMTNEIQEFGRGQGRGMGQGQGFGKRNGNGFGRGNGMRLRRRDGSCQRVNNANNNSKW